MRRTVRRTIGLTAVAVSLAALATAAVPTLAATTTSVGPWSQTNADAALSRSNRSESVLTVRTVAGVHYLRSLTANPPPGDPEAVVDCPGGKIVAPVLSGGAVYAVIGDWLTKADASTGRILWRVKPDPSLRTFYDDVAVSRGFVLVASEGCLSQSQAGGTIQAFRADTGARAWSTPMPLGGSLSQMVVSRGYVVTIGEDMISRTVAVQRAATGALVWGKSVDSGVCEALYGVRVLVAAERVVYESCRKSGPLLVGRWLTTGARSWTRPGNWIVEAANSDQRTAGHHLYVLDDAGRVDDLIPQTGVTRFSLPGAAEASVVDAQRVYATCGSGADEVCAYDTATGALTWRVADPAEPLAAAGGVLYLADGTALNAATGANIAPVWLGTASALAVGNGHVAVVVEPRILDIYGLRGY
ncbi:MAG TPA: PQQ-binding-like beta-propeller repeat protein [Jatrophihabitans sp.]|nr:PQQ-binding-like beta-propeller repeat protein [Jatrophihabitans sp.]